MTAPASGGPPGEPLSPEPPSPELLRTGRQHVQALVDALPGLDIVRLQTWGRRLAGVLSAGGRLLAAGNGGSAAEAQHLTSELVGRLRDDRPPMSAIALHAETSSLTAIGNDYGFAASFARQVQAHGRPGDVLLALSTSGRSPNLLSAVEAARGIGLVTLALTGPVPSPLADLCDEVVAVGAASPATVQEAHLVAIHLICQACDAELGAGRVAAGGGPASTGAGAGEGTAGTTERPAATAAPRPAVTAPPRPAAAVTGRASVTGAPRPLVIVGDTLLDREVLGHADRLAPDAPVPVVTEHDAWDRPGGAGLAALLAAGDGREVTLITALADDPAGRRLAELLAAAGVSVVDLGLDGATPEKIRIRVAGRCLLRWDRGTGMAPAGGLLPPSGEQAIAAAGAVLVADYGRGLAGQPSVREVLEASIACGIPLVWDPHPHGAEPVSGLRLATPNAVEARHFAPNVAGDSLRAHCARGRALVQLWEAGAVAVTLGARGALLVGDADTPPLLAPARPAEASDPCGAGDRFAATAAGQLADGALPSQAVTVATDAACAFATAGGAAACGGTAARGGGTSLRRRTAPESAAGVADRSGELDCDAFAVADRVRAAGGTVVATGGCFDMLHAGHVAMLRQARALGDCLVVCLNSDESVRLRKGGNSPTVPAADRVGILRSLDCVDSVIVFDEDTPITALARLRPDVFVKGGDYALADLPETAVVESWGGQIVVLPYLTRPTRSAVETQSPVEEVGRRGTR